MEPQASPPPEPESEARAQPDQPAGEVDLLSIGLLVFFVSLILIVAALLVLPAIF